MKQQVHSGDRADRQSRALLERMGHSNRGSGGSDSVSWARRLTTKGRFDSFVDSFAGRLCEASGDVLKRLRHVPDTQETP